METIIPILIAVVIFAFQAYSNFQKEQEKAQKRNLGQPPLPEDNADRRAHIPPMPAQQPAIPVNAGFEAYSGVMDAEGATRVYKSGQRPAIPTRLAISEETHDQATFDTAKFDLRDAVIKSVILERPYR